jgi:multiple sugar transport system ATP-binding protein
MTVQPRIVQGTLDHLSLSGIGKTYRGPALRDIYLDVRPGEILAITGPSGAGKTTLCRIIAGLETADAGRIALGGRDLASVPASARRVALMFESYALYPHLSVLENVLSPLRAPNAPPLPPSAQQAAAMDVLGLLEIAHLTARLPAALSGGQKQRVALARCIVQQPAAFLLDEPISHLDAKLRHKLRGALRRLLVARAVPTIWSTPDGMEALSVADRVAVIHAGKLEQVATPDEIWQSPATVQVARLIGDPPVNLLNGGLETSGGTTRVVAPQGRIALPDALAAKATSSASREVTLGIRPGCISLAPAGAAGIAAELYSYEPFGKHAIATLDAGGGVLLKAKIPTLGEDLSDAAIGERVTLAVDPSGLLLFDAASGKAL